MRLEINPLNFEGFYCFDNPLLSLAAYKKLEYRLVFSNSFGFEYFDDFSSNDNLLGSRIGNGMTNNEQLIEMYCGIKITKQSSATSEQIIEIIRQQLAQGIPTIIYIAAYWCPWHVNHYQKLPHDHFCLAVGLDSNNIICIDPVLSSEFCFLPYEDFSKGFGSYYLISITAPEKFDKKIVFNKSIKRILKFGMYDKIRLFSQHFLSDFDFKKEFAKFETNVFDVYIHRNLGSIAAGRLLFIKFIEYVFDENLDSNLQSIINDINLSASKWYSIRAMLTKSCFLEFTTKTKNKIFSMLNDIAEMEESIINSLSEYSQNKCFSINVNQLPTLNKTNVKNYTYLDLSDFFNNIAFHNSKLTEHIANFTGTGHYFICEDLPGDILQSGYNQYKFPDVGRSRPDNIVCESQEIKIPHGTYNKIAFLGCSDWGNFTDYIVLNYANGYNERKLISLTDWYLDIPASNEVIAWKGRVFQKLGSQIIDQEKKNNIFSIEIYLENQQNLESIKLPDCLNMHIFAITLCS